MNDLLNHFWVRVQDIYTYTHYIIFTGKNTPQYEVMLQSMEDIIRSIKSTPSTHSTLRVKFKAKSWIDIISECSEEELVLCGMEKIRQDISNYSVFMKMLQDTQGLDTLVSIIEERMRGYGESASHPWKYLESFLFSTQVVVEGVPLLRGSFDCLCLSLCVCVCVCLSCVFMCVHPLLLPMSSCTWTCVNILPDSELFAIQ